LLHFESEGVYDNFMAKGKGAAESSKEKPVMEVLAVKEEKTIFEWEALERPFQQKDKEFWTTVISILGLVCLILFFVKEWFLIAAVCALVFLYYVLTTVPPQKGQYRITTKGIYASPSQRIDWEALRRFWIDEKWGHKVIHLETWLNFPKVVSFVINTDDEKKVGEIVKKYIPQEQASPNALDKFSGWLAKKVPLEGKKN